MSLKHVHFAVPGNFLEIVRRLQTKLGLTSRTALFMHCVMRVSEQEGITRNGLVVKAGAGAPKQEH